MNTDLGLVLAKRRPLSAEAQLVDELKAGSSEAWAWVYDSYYGKLYRYALVRLGSTDLAEDVAATVFQRALTAIDSYSYRGRPLLAWLYRIARNVVSEHQRVSFRLRATSLLTKISFRGDGSFSQSSLELTSASARESNRFEAAAVIDRLDLRRALDRLTADQREVILLRYFIGLSAQEASAVLGKTERAVYALQTRAIEALRRHLQ